MSDRKADPMALVLEHEGERLVFKATYATLAALEGMDGDWKGMLAQALAFESPSPHFQLTALLTGRTVEEIMQISPPITKTQSMNIAAWRELMEGPEALREYLAEQAKLDAEDAAEDGESTEGKPMTILQALRRIWSTRFGLRSA